VYNSAMIHPMANMSIGELYEVERKRTSGARYLRGGRGGGGGGGGRGGGGGGGGDRKMSERRQERRHYGREKKTRTIENK